jgi:hypothetical protein
MNPILSDIQTVVENKKTTYLAHIPQEVIDVLKERGNIPNPPYIRWEHYSTDKFYYLVTFGTEKSSMKNPLLPGNITELPERIAHSLETQSYRSFPLKPNKIAWDIVTWKGKPIARARILFGYGENAHGRLVFGYFILSDFIKEYLNLHGRSKLYWKQVDNNTWLISKDRKDYDAVTWNVWDKIKLPKKIILQIGFYTEAEEETELTLKDGKPAVLLRVNITKAKSIDTFLTNALEVSKRSVEIHKLFNAYIKATPKEQLDPDDFDLCDLVFKLYNFRIISNTEQNKICKHRDRPFYIHGFALKTTERGDDG